MRSCCALYVDAGYLLAAAATRVAGTSLRGSVNVDHAALIAALEAQVREHSALPLTRTHWYDSGRLRGGQPDTEQDLIGTLPRVKLRLGRLSYAGEQKGVDLRLGLDLVTDAQGPTVDVAYLVSGDDDLTEAVEEAQRHGTNVNVLAVPALDDSPYGVARHLLRAADELLLIGAATIDGAVRKVGSGLAPAATPHPTPIVLSKGTRPAPTPRPTPAHIAPSGVAFSTSTGQPLPEIAGPASGEDLEAAVDEVTRRVIGSWVLTATDSERQTLRRSRPHIPSHIDRALLLDLARQLHVDELDELERVQLRARFWAVLDQTVAAGAPSTTP